VHKPTKASIPGTPVDRRILSLLVQSTGLVQRAAIENEQECNAAARG